MFRLTQIGLGTITSIIVGALTSCTSKPKTAIAPPATPAPTVTVTATATATATATPTPDPTAESSKSEGYKIGDEIEVSGRKIKVTNVLQYPNGISFDNEYPDPIPGRIIVVPMSVANTSTETGNMAFSRFSLKDKQGRTYTEIDSVSVYSWKREHSIATRQTDMFPGEKRTDAVLFRVAPDADGFSMEWKGNNIELTTVNSQSNSTQKISTTPDTKSRDSAMRINGRDYTTHVNLRSEPNTQSSVVAEVHTGDKADYIDKTTNNTGERWYKVRVNGNAGWVYEDLISSDGDD